MKDDRHVTITLFAAIHAMEALHVREGWYRARGKAVPQVLRDASSEMTRIVSDELGRLSDGS